MVVAQPIGPDNKSCVDVSLAIGKATFTATAHNKAVAKRQCALTAVAELMRQGESFFREAVKSHFTVVLAQTSSSKKITILCVLES